MYGKRSCKFFFIAVNRPTDKGNIENMGKKRDENKTLKYAR